MQEIASIFSRIYVRCDFCGQNHHFTNHLLFCSSRNDEAVWWSFAHANCSINIDVGLVHKAFNVEIDTHMRASIIDHYCG